MKGFDGWGDGGDVGLGYVDSSVWWDLYCERIASVNIEECNKHQVSFIFLCTSLTSIIIENPDCEIYDESSTIARAYAEKYGCNFDTIDHAPKPVKTLGDISDAAYILQYAAIKGANGKEFDIRELVK